MEETNKEIQEETTETVKTTEVNQEEIADSIVDKIKSLFKKDKQDETKFYTEAEVTEMAKQMALEQVNAIAAKTKRKETEKVQEEASTSRLDIENAKKALEAEKNALQTEKQFLKLGIPEKYQEFIKFELSKGDKSLEDFLKENPHYVDANSNRTVVTNIKPQVDKATLDYIEFYKKNNG